MPVLATDGITLPDFNFTLIEMNNKLSEIHRKQCEIEQRVQIVNERLVALEQTLPLGTPNSINKVGNDQLPKKKFSSFDELQEFEANFTEETRKQMLYHIKLCGGKDYKDATKRYLKLLFTNQFARTCSWTGQKNHHKLKDLEVVKVIKEAVCSCYNVTSRDFEIVLMDWFRYATQRDKREKSSWYV
ncbi:uncharacterized protein LOC116182050 [Photinus pyralis]|uniref:uncharacterized protein LOC116182050 n=1 Tax=Photinus pyralis TaxID=7054 RepID=UPI001266E701|nr:uncharacterized protein LOC116182050 [Photinus pyralis]